MRPLHLLALLLLPVATLAAEEFTVYPSGTGGTHPTIAAAVADAEHGDTIFLMAGTFRGPGNRDVLVDRDIDILNGEDESPIIQCDGSPAEPHRAFILEYCDALLSGLTIRGGYAAEGGAVRIEEGAPTIEWCVFENNTASSAGGAVHIFEVSQVFITRSIFAGNYSEDSGGAIHNDQESTLTLERCSFLYNGAAEGGHLYSRQDATIAIERCILAFGHEGAATAEYFGGPVSLACSDVFANVGGDFTGPLQGLGGGDNLSVDPWLCDPMGGHFEPAAGSPVGLASSCGSMGARYENTQWAIPTRGVAADGTGQYPTIAAAIAGIPAGGTVLLEDGTYRGEGNRDLVLPAVDLVIASRGGLADSCVIDAEGTPEENHRHFEIPASATSATHLQNLKLLQGHTSLEGGSVRIMAEGSPSFVGCIFEDNRSESGGGAIYQTGGENGYSHFSCRDCFFLNNQASLGGGDINARFATIGLQGCRFQGSSTIASGGGSLSYYGFMGGSIDNCRFVETQITGPSPYHHGGGGALWLGNGTDDLLLIRDSEFHSCANQTEWEGGAVTLANPGRVQVTDCLFESSRTDSIGADIDAIATREGNRVEILHCDFLATDDPDVKAGSLSFQRVDLHMEECTVSGYRGDRVWTSALTVWSADAFLEGCTFRDNTSRFGGAFRSVDSTVEVHHCLFLDNEGLAGGGAWHTNSSDIEMTRCEFMGNHAGTWGGAMDLQGALDGEINISQVIFDRNSSETHGGAVTAYPSNSVINLENCTFHANAVTSNEGEAAQVYMMQLNVLNLENCIISGGIACQGLDGYTASNLHTGCSNIWGNEDGDWVGRIADQADQNGNISADPRFCDPDADIFTLDVTSPCLPANNSCGVLMGAKNSGCASGLSAVNEVTARTLTGPRAHPNPFNPFTQLEFRLPAAGPVHLTVHDLAGRVVRRLLQGETRDAGVHRMNWDGRDESGQAVASGVYLARLESGGQNATRKLMLTK